MEIYWICLFRLLLGIKAIVKSYDLPFTAPFDQFGVKGIDESFHDRHLIFDDFRYKVIFNAVLV